MVLAHAATRRKGERENKKLIGRYDVSVAFLHAEATGKIAVVPPKDVDEGHLWYLLKAMNEPARLPNNGPRRSPKQRSSADSWRWHLCPDCFIIRSTIWWSCHEDDFLASSSREALDFLDEIMVKEYETKILPRIGPAHLGGQCSKGEHLHREIS